MGEDEGVSPQRVCWEDGRYRGREVRAGWDAKAVGRGRVGVWAVLDPWSGGRDLAVPPGSEIRYGNGVTTTGGAQRRDVLTVAGDNPTTGRNGGWTLDGRAPMGV